MLAARTLPSVHLSAPSRRSARSQRAAVTVAAAAPVTVTTLPDGRKIEVYPTTGMSLSRAHRRWGLRVLTISPPFLSSSRRRLRRRRLLRDRLQDGACLGLSGV
jgi:hypothetical protein